MSVSEKMLYSDKSVGYVIARESSRDVSSKLLYRTEAVVALMMQSWLSSSKTAQHKDNNTAVIVDKSTIALHRVTMS